MTKDLDYEPFTVHGVVWGKTLMEAITVLPQILWTQQAVGAEAVPELLSGKCGDIKRNRDHTEPKYFHITITQPLLVLLFFLEDLKCIQLLYLKLLLCIRGNITTQIYLIENHLVIEHIATHMLICEEDPHK